MNGYKAVVMRKLHKHACGYSELTDDIFTWDISRFAGKLEELVEDGYVKKEQLNGDSEAVYSLTELGLELVGGELDCANCQYENRCKVISPQICPKEMFADDEGVEEYFDKCYFQVIYQKAVEKHPKRVYDLVEVFSNTDMDNDEYLSHLEIIAEDDGDD